MGRGVPVAARVVVDVEPRRRDRAGRRAAARGLADPQPGARRDGRAAPAAAVAALRAVGRARSPTGSTAGCSSSSPTCCGPWSSRVLCVTHRHRPGRRDRRAGHDVPVRRRRGVRRHARAAPCCRCSCRARTSASATPGCRRASSRPTSSSGRRVGAFLFAVGTVWPFIVQVVCVALGALLVARIATPPGAPRDLEGTHVRRDIADGLRWIRRHPPVRTLALVILAFNVTWGAAWSVLVLWSQDVLGMGAGRLRPADHRGGRRRAGRAPARTTCSSAGCRSRR